MSKLNPTNAVNNPDGNTIKNRSRFDLTHRNYQTFRFGEYSPHFAMSTVPSDNINLKSEHSCRTLSLKAPLMSSVSLKKDYFNVPMQALLPRNWEKVYKNPINGDDVDSPVGTFTPLFIDYVRRCFLNMRRLVDFNGSYGFSLADNLTWLFKTLIFGEQFYSAGSLFNNLGAKLNRYFRCYQLKDLITGTYQNGNYTYDRFFDNLLNHFIKAYTSDVYDYRLDVTFYDYEGNVDDTFVLVVNSPANEELLLELNNHITLRDFLEKIRHNSNWKFSHSEVMDTAWIEEYISYFMDSTSNSRITETSRGLNLARPMSYQIVCAHYYSSDNVDSIYTAELYRQLQGSYLRSLEIRPSFDYNGVATDYDFLSGHCVEEVFKTILNTIDVYDGQFQFDTTRVIYCLSYLANIFSFRRSLRYRDYFVGARTAPLAVGNVDIAVNSDNSSISVIDVSKNIQKQRFLNAVNRVGNKVESYLKELFGVVPAYDFHNPAWLGQTTDTVGHYEVQNTATEQLSKSQSITSLMRSNASKAAFSFSSDRPSVLIGITWYDIPRVYTYSIDRELMHEDRFDMFVPQAQYTGDQPIFVDELGFFNDELTDKEVPFGFTLPYMEFKQKYDTASGGFIENLPGFAFLGDTTIPTGRGVVISPDFVRSKNSDLDSLFVSFGSAYSLGSYFHFVTANTNYVNASRPMAFAPTIL